MDVNIYASGTPGRAKNSTKAALAGNHENTDVGNFLADYLDLDLAQVTKLLREKSAAWDEADTVTGKTIEGSWMGHLPNATGWGFEEFDDYHGEYKRCLH